MFNSAVLDVAIGVIFGFLAVSLITSAAVEALNSACKWRSSTLLAGIKSLVNDPSFNALAAELYQHAAINPRGSDTAPLTNKPAYIDKTQFAAAFLDVTGLSGAGPGLAPGPAAVAALRNAIAAKFPANAGNPQMVQMLTGMVQRANGDIDLVKKELASWFDNAMDRVGGAFKRWTQLLSALVALVIAVLFNVDAFHVASQVWQQPTLSAQLKVPAAAQLVLPASASPDAHGVTQAQIEAAALAMGQVLDQKLPLGWPPGQFLQVKAPGEKDPTWIWEHPSLFARSFCGWLVTALATLFGAPFWFDVLQGFVRLKGAGPSPAEKISGGAASA
jgi:hypothetical protein